MLEVCWIAKCCISLKILSLSSLVLKKNVARKKRQAGEQRGSGGGETGRTQLLRSRKSNF